MTAEQRAAMDDVKLFVWTDRRPRKALINLNNKELLEAVSSGHDNDWDYTVNKINRNILEGLECGTTEIERYTGGGKDVVYWELEEKIN